MLVLNIKTESNHLQTINSLYAGDLVQFLVDEYSANNDVFDMHLSPRTHLRQ